MVYQCPSPVRHTRLFYKRIQNKIHFAVHGHTAAELIVERASAEKEHMGLTTWENAPSGKIVKTDVCIAKNYLKESELDDMGHLVNALLDLAERMANRHIPMTMEDWANRVDIFLNASLIPPGVRSLALHASTSLAGARNISNHQKVMCFDKRQYLSIFGRNPQMYGKIHESQSRRIPGRPL